jgi:hypothetical protein
MLYTSLKCTMCSTLGSPMLTRGACDTSGPVRTQTQNICPIWQLLQANQHALRLLGQAR